MASRLSILHDNLLHLKVEIIIRVTITFIHEPSITLLPDQTHMHITPRPMPLMMLFIPSASRLIILLNRVP